MQPQHAKLDCCSFTRSAMLYLVNCYKNTTGERGKGVHSAAGREAGRYGRQVHRPIAKQLVPDQDFGVSLMELHGGGAQLKRAWPRNWLYLARTTGCFACTSSSSGGGRRGSGLWLGRYFPGFFCRRLSGAHRHALKCTWQFCCQPACNCNVVYAQDAAFIAVIKNIKDIECGRARHVVAIR